MGEVEAGQGDLFLADVLPDVHLCPVGDGEDAEVFAFMHAAVEDVPELGTLVFGVPLAEVVAVAEEAFFGACFFFVAAAATEACVVFTGGNGV